MILLNSKIVACLSLVALCSCLYTILESSTQTSVICTQLEPSLSLIVYWIMSSPMRMFISACPLFRPRARARFGARHVDVDAGVNWNVDVNRNVDVESERRRGKIVGVSWNVNVERERRRGKQTSTRT